MSVEQYKISVEEMAKQLVKVSKFKPKNLVSSTDGTAKTMYKPRASTSVYTVYYKALNAKMDNNPFVDKYMLDNSDTGNISIVVDYFIDVKRARSEELENKVIQKLQTFLLQNSIPFDVYLWHVIRYCKKLKVESWPELQQILETNLNLNEDVNKLNNIALNSGRVLREELQESIKAILSFKNSIISGLICLNSLNPERLNNTLDVVFEWLFAILDLPIIKNNPLTVRELSDVKFLDLLNNTITDKHAKNHAVLYTKFLDAGFRGLSSETSTNPNYVYYGYLSVLAEVFSKTKEETYWREFLNTLASEAVGNPYMVLDICEEIKYRLPEDVESRVFEVVTQERIEEFNIVIERCLQSDSSWSRRYQLNNFHCDSYCNVVVNYIFKCLKNRTKYTDNFFMSIRHAGLFNEYVEKLQLLVRQGVKLNPV